ncbi:crtp2, partial [Symbiodinium necroappetens]
YVVFNLCMNVTTLLAVKYGSALGTFVALKAIFPVSMVLFAYVQWPLLGKTDIHWLTW